LRKILLASHGKFADGIYDSLQMIMGEQKRVSTLCAFVDRKTDLKKEIEEIISSLSEHEELIVITDIFGGSVNNLFMQYVSKSRIHLISGLNLPLLIEMVSRVEEEPENTESWLLKILDTTKNTIMYCNDLLVTNSLEEENF